MPTPDKRFFVFDAEENEHYFFATAEERDKHAKDVIAAYNDEELTNEIGQEFIRHRGKIHHQTSRHVSPRYARAGHSGAKAAHHHRLR